MLSVPSCYHCHRLSPLAGTNGGIFADDDHEEPINDLRSHKSAITVFVDKLIRNISFDQIRASHHASAHHNVPQPSSCHRTTQNVCVDYLHPTWWSAWDHNNPHKIFFDRLEMLQNRRDASHVYRARGSEAAHRVIRQNLALIPTRKDIHDEALLRILERECEAIIHENNAVFLELQGRIASYQLERSRIRCRVPIAEEPAEAAPAVRPDADTTMTAAECSQRNTITGVDSTTEKRESNTYRWSDFDSDDEELPDISDFLLGWTKPIIEPGDIEGLQIGLHIDRASALDEQVPELDRSAILSGEPLAAGGNSASSEERRVICTSPRLPVILEESEDDQEDFPEGKDDTVSDDDSSTYSSPPYTPIDVNEDVGAESLKAPHYQNCTFQLFGRRTSALQIGDENQRDRRHGS